VGWTAHHATNFRRKFSCIHRPPITRSYSSYFSVSHLIAPAERQPCRGATSLRPHPYGHPYGPHTLLLGYHHFLRPRVFGRRPSHPASAAYILAGDHRTPRQPHIFWPEAIATARPPACILAGGHRTPRQPHIFWPEAIAARWSCGPHVAPAQIVVDDAELGYHAHPQHGTSEMCRLCCAHFLLVGLGLPTVTKNRSESVHYR
jgi:hypothetical protein